jgi:hypothetical protein
LNRETFEVVWDDGFPRYAALFGLANIPYNESAISNDTGMLFGSFQGENAAWSALGSNYFASARSPSRTISVTNSAVSIRRLSCSILIGAVHAAMHRPSPLSP